MLHQRIKNRLLAAVVLLLAAVLVLPAAVNAQTKYQAAGNVKITVEGTSNIHDWEMNTEKGTSTAFFTLSPAGAITAVNSVAFVMKAEDLKSEHKAMDKNTYNALHTDKNPSISFVSGAATVQPTGSNSVAITAKGKLTIAGVSKDVTLLANGVVNADKSITCTGSYKIKMTDYSVEPPSIMFGTIKTGNDLNIKFTLQLKAS